MRSKHKELVKVPETYSLEQIEAFVFYIHKDSVLPGGTMLTSLKKYFSRIVITHNLSKSEIKESTNPLL